MKTFVKKSLMAGSLILLALMVLLIPFGTLAMAEEPEQSLQVAPLSPDYLKYLEDQTAQSESGAAGSAGSASEFHFGYVPPSFDFSQVSSGGNSGDLLSVSTLPDAFDWRDEGVVTSVKNQQDAGTCWVFGSLAALESRVSIIDNLTYDFSEQNLYIGRSSAYTGTKNSGGNAIMSTDTLVKMGTRLESTQSYNTATLDTEACVTTTSPLHQVTDFRYVATSGIGDANIAKIKAAIYNYGPVLAAYYMDSDYMYTGYKYYYPECSISANHMICIVGWDDDLAHPEGGGSGAWIVKNSWGSGWGNSGYFYLCYDSANLCLAGSYHGSAGYEDYDANKKIYYWDEAGLVGGFGYGTSSLWMRNVFTAEEDTYLTAVAFWTTDDNASYQIVIRNNSDTSLSTQTGTCDEVGYYTIDLLTPVSLTSGQVFKVDVKLTTSGYKYPVPVELKTGNYNPVIQSGVSYVKTSSGSVWKDVGASEGCNVCLRAITNTEPAPEAPSDLIATVLSNSEIQLDWTDNSDDETGFKIERKLSSGTTYKQVGTVETGVTTYTSAGMTAETSYDFRVMANNGASFNSEYSDTVTVVTLTEPPSAPKLSSPKSGSTVSSLTPTLEWKASSGAVAYGLQLSDSSKFETLLLDESGIAGTNLTVPEGILSWNTKYYWKVSAANEQGSVSKFSSVGNFKSATGPPPLAPSNLKAEALSSTQIELSWTDNSDDETGFKIERKLTADTVTKFKQVGTVSAGVTTYTSTGMKAETSYDFRVMANNGASFNSEYSDTVTVVTLTEPPSAPKLFSPKSGSTVSSLTPTLEWKASSGAVAYGLQLSDSSKFETLLLDESGLAGTNLTVPEGILSWNTKYYWKVSAANEQGSVSKFSSVGNFKSAIGPPPLAPSNLKAEALSSTQIELSWTDNSDDETGFRIERKLSSGTTYKQVGKVEAGVITYTSTGMKAETSYDFRVVANNGASLFSDYTDAVTAVTWTAAPKAPALTAPANNAKVDGLTPVLTWTPSATGAAAVAYNLQISTSSTFNTLLVEETDFVEASYEVSGDILSASTKYYWRVASVDAYGQSSSWLKRAFKTP